MKIWSHAHTEEVADGRQATPSQPPRATLTLAAKASSSLTPHPIRSSPSLNIPDALREGLRCSPASRLLPIPPHAHRKNQPVSSQTSKGNR